MDERTVLATMGEAMIARGLATPQDLTENLATFDAARAGQESPGAQPINEPFASTKPFQAQPAPMGETPLDRAAQAGSQGPASPSAYQFDSVPGVGPDPKLDPEGFKKHMESTMRSDAEFRQFLYEEQIPVPIAKEINRLALQASKVPQTVQQREVAQQETMATLTRLWGADRDKNLSIVRAEVARMTASRPQVKELLETTGMGNNAWLITTLHNLATMRGRTR